MNTNDRLSRIKADIEGSPHPGDLLGSKEIHWMIAEIERLTAERDGLRDMLRKAIDRFAPVLSERERFSAALLRIAKQCDPVDEWSVGWNAASHLACEALRPETVR